jgi:hypothetical protein
VVSMRLCDTCRQCEYSDTCGGAHWGNDGVVGFAYKALKACYYVETWWNTNIYKLIDIRCFY